MTFQTREQLLDRVDALQWALTEITTPPAEWMGALSGISLTQSETRFLGALMSHPNRVVTRDAIHAALYWDRATDDWPEPKIIDVIVCHLRKRLPPSITIETAWGVGYRARVAS